jgi:hypothetical protein
VYKSILVLVILMSFWSCETNLKPIATLKKTILEESEIISDSILYNNQNIDSIWLYSDFDSAVAVILNGSHEIIHDVSKMDEIYSSSSRRKLKETQLKSITSNLSGRVPSNYMPADCFQPYHGFFFYKNGSIKARIAICFSCGTYFSKPKNCGGINFELTKQLIHDLGLPVYNWDDSTEVKKSNIKYSDYF